MHEAQAAQEKALRDAEVWVEWANGIRNFYLDSAQRLFPTVSPGTLLLLLSVTVLCGVGSWLWLSQPARGDAEQSKSASGVLTNINNSVDYKTGWYEVF